MEVYNPLEGPALVCPVSNIICTRVTQTKIMRALEALLLLLLMSVGMVITFQGVLRMGVMVSTLMTIIGIVMRKVEICAVMEIGMLRANAEEVAVAKPDADVVAGN